jgi:threonine/homoserine/homoserine lactone efflux protein
MPDAAHFSLFLIAALLLAIAPGPSLLYVLTRSLEGGRREGLASSFGGALGGLVHVIGGAFGLSALLAASAIAFAVVKYVGAAYLIFLGVRTLMKNSALPTEVAPGTRDTWRSFRQGILTEVFNPKSALFFLAFIPQFVDTHHALAPQFLVLGCISVALNTSADVIVAFTAGPIGQWLKRSERFRRLQRRATGWTLIGLGAYVAVADDRR